MGIWQLVKRTRKPGTFCHFLQTFYIALSDQDWVKQELLRGRNTAVLVRVTATASLLCASPGSGFCDSPTHSASQIQPCIDFFWVCFILFHPLRLIPNHRLSNRQHLLLFQLDRLLKMLKMPSIPLSDSSRIRKLEESGLYSHTYCSLLLEDQGKKWVSSSLFLNPIYQILASLLNQNFSSNQHMKDCVGPFSSFVTYYIQFPWKSSHLQIIYPIKHDDSFRD